MRNRYAFPDSLPETGIAMKPKDVRASLDWDGLQAFLAVCETGAMARAAKRLGVGHATVIRRLAALEAALGSPLLALEDGAYALTSAGEDLQANLTGMEARIRDAWTAVRGADDRIHGTIRITTTDTLLQGLLGPHLERFCRAHPDVRLQIVVRNQFLSLARRDADVAIRGSNRPPENLIGRHVGDIQTAPYASKDYLDGRRRRTLAQHDWIALHESLAHLEQAKWLRRHVGDERVVMRADSLVGMTEAVAAGLGAGMLLRPLAERHANLVRLAKPDAALDTQIWVLSHPDLRQVARVRAFTQYLYEALRADPGLQH